VYKYSLIYHILLVDYKKTNVAVANSNISVIICTVLGIIFLTGLIIYISIEAANSSSRLTTPTLTHQSEQIITAEPVTSEEPEPETLNKPVSKPVTLEIVPVSKPETITSEEPKPLEPEKPVTLKPPEPVSKPTTLKPPEPEKPVTSEEPEPETLKPPKPTTLEIVPVSKPVTITSEEPKFVTPEPATSEIVPLIPTSYLVGVDFFMLFTLKNKVYKALQKLHPGLVQLEINKSSEDRYVNVLVAFGYAKVPFNQKFDEFLKSVEQLKGHYISADIIETQYIGIIVPNAIAELVKQKYPGVKKTGNNTIYSRDDHETLRIRLDGQQYRILKFIQSKRKELVTQ
jgi:hypothetical protein